jgi:bacterial/archaeal transporter family protein
VLSGLGTGASWLCYFRALKLGPATLVAPIDKLSVVLVALFGVSSFSASGPRSTAGSESC